MKRKAKNNTSYLPQKKRSETRHISRALDIVARKRFLKMIFYELFSYCSLPFENFLICDTIQNFFVLSG